METLNLDLNKRYTYADYLTWLDDVRRELFDGFIKLMSPAPYGNHQRILSNLTRPFTQYLYKKTCRVYFAPFDVRLPKQKDEFTDKQIYTVVQPDICVICDLSKLDKRGCIGAPDLIIEIVSAKNARRDVVEKKKLYQDHGVREYWLVFPKEQTVTVWLLDEQNKYQIKGMYAEDEQIKVNIFDDLYIDVNDIFEM